MNQSKVGGSLLLSNPRLGFCCKYISESGDLTVSRRMNVTTTTMAALGRLAPAAAFDKLASVVRHNLAAVAAQIEHVAGRPSLERALRLSSDLLPGYTHPNFRDLYRDRDLSAAMEEGFAAAGQLAHRSGIRLSMHPDQFCVLATANPAALQNTVAELEYHTDIMRMLGYGAGWHPDGAHINVHGGARAPSIEGFRVGFAQLSEAARNLLTVENDEVSYGLDDLLPLGDTLPIVLDLHHHWIASKGEYLEPEDPRIARVAASWRDVRPMSHISVSRETLLPGQDVRALPDFAALTAAGVSARDLRGHSDLMWNEAISDLVARHLAWTDFEVEAKLKNLSSEPLARHVERRLAERAVAAE
jgi:UV DNA damage endonuclease